jgi:hypothetical protein
VAGCFLAAGLTHHARTGVIKQRVLRRPATRTLSLALHEFVRSGTRLFA